MKWFKINSNLKPAISPEALSKKWSVGVDVINKALDKGQGVEREHTDSDDEARQIASHHISESLAYYDLLESIEKKASGGIRLWLDDCRPMLPPFTLWAKDAPQAIAAIDTGKVEHISLDHDLGAIAGQRELTGYDVAKHIEELAFNNKIRRMTWAVHSANPDGAERIRMAMDQADKFWTKNEQLKSQASLAPEKSKDILAKLNVVASKNGYKAYAVGGFVRDEILGRPPKDLDIVAIKDEDGINAGINFATLVAKEYNLHPPVTFPRFGTAKIDIDGEEVEFVAPRKEKYSSDSRKPDVERGTLEDDARRRDFTVNALYKDIGTGEIIDPTGNGLNDIKSKTIRVTDYDNPDVIFSEDPLRALRAIRQSYALGFKMEEKTQEAIKRNVDRLPVISQERIRDEFSKILTGPKAGEAVRLMHDIGLTKQFMPELDETFGVGHDSKYHQETVDEHILAAIDLVPSDITSRLVALLHDISKPAKKTVVDGIAHFYEHEDLGAETAEKILTRMKFPTDIIQEVVFRVKNHMKPHSNPETWGPKAIRRFMKDMGEYLDKVLDFAEADINAAKRDDDIAGTEVEQLRGLRTRIEEEKAKGVTPEATPPLIDGNELQKMFNKPPGKWIGELHKHLADLQLENPAMTKEEAIEKAKNFMEHYDNETKPEENKETTASIGPRTCNCGHCTCGADHSRNIVCGTVGFNVPSWEGSFYPKGLKESEKLLYFAMHIPSVEINVTTHLIPRRDVFERWAAQTPEEFIFSFRVRYSSSFSDTMELLFNRICSTIGHHRLGAISIVIPQGTPYYPGVVYEIYDSVPAHAYAFDIRSMEWVNEKAYEEISKCGGTIVRNHLHGGQINGIWSYLRMPIYKSLKEAGLGDSLRVFSSTEVLDPQETGEMYVYVQDEGGRYYNPDGDTKPSPNLVLELMKVLKKKYKPSPVDLSIMPKQFGGPSDPQTGPNNSAAPGTGTSTERLYGPMNAEEEEAVDIKKKKILKPGNTELTPNTTFDSGVQENDGLAGPAGKVDLGY